MISQCCRGIRVGAAVHRCVQLSAKSNSSTNCSPRVSVASLGTINQSLIEVIEFGLPYPPAVGEHEPIQMLAISTSERAIDRISERTDAVRTGPSDHSPRPELLAAAA